MQIHLDLRIPEFFTVTGMVAKPPVSVGESIGEKIGECAREST